jgi:hypothetical protein
MARRSSGRSSSRSSSSSRGGSRSTTRTTRKTTRVVGMNGRSFSGSRFYVDYGTYRPIGWVLGRPYLDPTYGNYYDGMNTYRPVQPMNPIVAIIIVVVVCGFIVVVGLNSRDIEEDDDYEEVVETTVTEEHFDGQPAGQVYAPGTNPPGTALCNDGHIFQFMTTNPYPDDSTTCDNCQ